jgi:hypothetical protein
MGESSDPSEAAEVLHHVRKDAGHNRASFSIHAIMAFLERSEVA